MTAVTFASMAGVFFGLTLSSLSLFLILLVLVQRGKGGGLTGALGGPGGQSAFGTKAGDMFTKITSVVALVWIFLCGASVYVMGNARPSVDPPVAQTPAVEGLGTAGEIDDDAEGAALFEAADDAPATETPATETPATETPATETPATETPATETPATEDAPTADDAPATEDAPETEEERTEEAVE